MGILVLHWKASRFQCSVLNAELSIEYNVEPSPTGTSARNHWLDQLSRCRPFLASEEVWRAQRWCVCHIIYLLIKDNGEIHASNYLFSRSIITSSQKILQPSLNLSLCATNFGFCKICFSYIPEIFWNPELFGNHGAKYSSSEIPFKRPNIGNHIGNDTIRSICKSGILASIQCYSTVWTWYHNVRSANDETAIETVIRMNATD